MLKELEELLIQKIVETIAMRSEIGQLREQARISERYQETTRVKMQQLMKQVKDFEMVLSRNAIDRRANPDKPVAPIKINRSVGLQVSFITVLNYLKKILIHFRYSFDVMLTILFSLGTRNAEFTASYESQACNKYHE